MLAHAPCSGLTVAIPALTWFEVEQYAPELTGKIVPLAQNFILTTVNTLIAESVWNTITPMARVLYAAHLATLERRKGQPGYATSRSMGGVSESYGGSPLSSSFMSLTGYGQAYLGLAKTRSFRAGFTTGMVGGKISGNGY